MLAQGVPLALGFGVYGNWDNVPISGVISENTANEAGTYRGGHAVLIVGYVRNANLPVGIPPAAVINLGPDVPSDGGYFIIRNSWGVCWGDGGYAYMSWKYALARGTTLVPIQ
mmetsp:Transcript_37087/g.60069  ORF Transcript_37087/g.60069 Transcript_37087/m.60069 type:complete len:113 (+) Transcript_37087:1011-1349(+)